MRRLAVWTLCVVVGLGQCALAADLTVRDRILLKVDGQARYLILQSTNARLVKDVMWGGNPTGTLLKGDFSLRLAKKDGTTCGMLSLGELSFPHGEDYDTQKVLLAGDYNGDGRAWEVALMTEFLSSNVRAWVIVGVDPASRRLERWSFGRGGERAAGVAAIPHPHALEFRQGCLRARGYDNSFEMSDSGYYEELYRWNAAKRVWSYVKSVPVAKVPAMDWPPK